MNAGMDAATDLYAPTASDRARQEFVLGLKLLANGAMQQAVRADYAGVVLPQLSAQLGRAPAARREMSRALARTSGFRSWAVFTHASQSMMWRAIDPTATRMAPEGTKRLQALRAPGSLTLNASLEVPTPVANTEIHRQPGGYVHAASEANDVLAGLRYIGASRIYAPGKSNDLEATDARGDFLVAEVRRRHPGIRPRRILDLGCGIGVASQAVARAFPDAEYHALDVAAGLLRFAHLLAGERGLPMHFQQCDAAKTHFPDAHFDLIVSNILFHETNAARLPQILRECRRLLRPGAPMLHVDVPTQVSRLGLADQVMNEWQVRWNGEAFWMAFAELDMRQEIIAAGFAPENSFAEHVLRPGAGPAYVFGAVHQPGSASLP